MGKGAANSGAGLAKPTPTALQGGAALLPGSAAAAAAEARHVHARLAQAFAVADSLDGGTVAAHEVGALLWRTGVVTAAAQLAALRPPPSDSAKRVGFEQALHAHACDAVCMCMCMCMCTGRACVVLAPEHIPYIYHACTIHVTCAPRAHHVHAACTPRARRVHAACRCSGWQLRQPTARRSLPSAC